MASRFEIVAPRFPADCWPVLEAAFDEIHRLEALLTVFRDDSEVSRLNREAEHRPVRVDDDLLSVLRTGLQLSRLTGGAFDLTSAPLSRGWGFLARSGRVPSDGEIEGMLSRVGWHHLKLDEAASTVRFHRPLELNLGAVGKGFALDRAAAIASRRLPSFLMHAGHSTILVGGPGPDGDGWPIGLRNPRRQDTDFAVVTLREGALSMSGAAEQKFAARGREYGHIIDPRSGRPARTHLSAIAVAPTAAVADALSTAFYLMSAGEVESFCRDHSRIGAVLLSRDRRIHRFGTDTRSWEVAC